MIAYPDGNQAEILARVTAHKPSWPGRAAIEQAAVNAIGAFTPPKAPKGQPKTKAPPSIWSEIKIVFMEIQRFKCIFCERALAKKDGSIEHDVEHYRPKNAIVPWKAPKTIPAVPHQAGPAATTGYYWLAYDLANYAAACKSCNSTRKGSYFPVYGQRGAAQDAVAQLNIHEEPLVIFPLAEDPAPLITFKGVLAVPVQTTGLAHLRALVTISLFNLNGREELLDDRFRAIRAVFGAFELLVRSPIQKIRDDAAVTLSELTSLASPQSACAKAYLELLRTDGDAGWQIYQEAREYVRSA